MSTETPAYERYAKPETSGPTVELISRFARLRVTLEHNTDEYTPMGGLRTTKQGRQVKFNNGRASVPEAWMEELRHHPDFGNTFWVKGDPTGVQANVGPEVIDGPMAAQRIPAANQPPLPEWDELGARQIRPIIMAGRVDLERALVWEFQHRNRQQVIEALRKARSENVESPGDDESPVEADEADGFVQPTPEE